MIKGSEYCFKETERAFNKVFVMTGKDKKDFKILLNVVFVKRTLFPSNNLLNVKRSEEGRVATPTHPRFI